MVKHDPTDAELRHLMDVAYRAAFRLLGSATDAEDVAQSAVVATVLRWSTVSAYADAWTARIAINGALGQLRTARRRAAFEQPTEGAMAEAVSLRVDLRRALRSLPRRQREAVALRYLADLPVAAVAATMGISEGAVKTHAHRGLAALRETLGTDLVRAESAEETDPARMVADTERQVSNVRTAR